MANKTQPRFSHTELLIECDLEIKMRKEVFGKRVSAGSMTEKTKEKRIAMMEAIRAIVEKDQPPMPKPEQTSIFG